MLTLCQLGYLAIAFNLNSKNGKGKSVKKLDLIIAVSAAIIGMYYMASLSQAYFMAVYAWQDARNSQIAQIIGGK